MSLKKVKINEKVQEIRLQRDLFGRMLGIAIKEKTDVEKILTFPITPVPMSLCHLDGSICKTEKSALKSCFQLSDDLPQQVNIRIIDGFYLLHCIKEIPQNFKNISKKILQTITYNNVLEIHIIFDRYFSPSIKDYERSLRGGTSTDYIISGPEQIRPADFNKELRNNKFKEALVKFLITDWENHEMATFIGNKIIFLNFDYCYQYVVDNERNVTKIINHDLSCPAHEEADTKIIYHA